MNRQRTSKTAWIPLGIGISIALAVVLGVGIPRSADAQTLICASHSLGRDDARRLKVAARTVVPTSAHVLIESACLNPGRAIGFLETEKVVTGYGVQQWWTMTCRRNAAEWRCGDSRFNQFIATSVEVGGKSRPVELSFDKESSLDHARILAALAIEIYTDPASRIPECGKKEPKDSEQLGKWDHHGPFPTGDNAIPISVSIDAKYSVALNDFGVRIQFRPSIDTAGFEAECWGLYIIVT